MAITLVGSVAFDSIETPAGRAERCLGGSATYFALAASFFTPVRVIAVVGEDFTGENEAALSRRSADTCPIDTVGLEHAPGKSFFWEGSYLEDLNQAKTHTTELNVFAAFDPKIPPSYLDSEFLFLANIDPVLQKRVRDQFPQVKLAAGDTMNYWINDHRANLLPVLESLDILLINDMEARLLAEDAKASLLQAARAVLALGPKALVVKHGEYGATAFFPSDGEPSYTTFRAPAVLLDQVVDPTGAGDSFAGGFFGYLASQPTLAPGAIRAAMFYGSVLGSFTVERFGTERLLTLARAEIDARFAQLRALTHLEVHSPDLG